MSEETNGRTRELRRIVRMLETTAAQATDLRHTGNDPSPAGVRTYNAALKHLIDTGEVPAAIFSPLPEDVSMAELAMTCSQLSEYLSADLPGGSEEEEDSGGKKLVIGQLNLGTRVGPGGSDPDEIAQIVRDYLAEWLGQGKKVPEQPPASEATPSAAASGTASASGGGARAETLRVLPTGARVEEVRAEAPGAVRS